MGRRLLFILGLLSAAYGGWLVHHEGALNTYCNAVVSNPAHGITVPSRCLDIVWSYAEGFLFTGGHVRLRGAHIDASGDGG